MWKSMIGKGPIGIGLIPTSVPRLQLHSPNLGIVKQLLPDGFKDLLLQALVKLLKAKFVSTLVMVANILDKSRLETVASMYYTFCLKPQDVPLVIVLNKEFWKHILPLSKCFFFMNEMDHITCMNQRWIFHTHWGHDDERCTIWFNKKVSTWVIGHKSDLASDNGGIVAPFAFCNNMYL